MDDADKKQRAEIDAGREAQIERILGTYDIDMALSTWRVHGKLVIYHSALEQIATKAKIAFILPTVVRAEADECVLIVSGSMMANEGLVTKWSTGEAKINVNYKVKGNQSPYVYAMAEKRGIDRVILKLIGLHGDVYSEDEADDFKAQIDNDKIARTIMEKIDEAKSLAEVEELMKHRRTTEELDKMIPAMRESVLEYGRARHKMLKLRSGAGSTTTRPAETRQEQPRQEQAQQTKPAQRFENASDRLTGGFGDPAKHKTPDEVLSEFTEGLKHSHTMAELDATCDEHRAAINALGKPDQQEANKLRALAIDRITKKQ